ncbi:MAG: alpha/beta hydrolase [Acidimicrobiia bacterium]|nr:alpha/beta hydrolase [Acidimicrobiia bacterium]
MRSTDRWPLTARLARLALTHPEPLLRLLGQRTPVWSDGRKLHPSMQLLCAAATRAGRGDRPFEVARMRREMHGLARRFSPLRQGVRVHDRVVDGTDGPVPLRLYRPYGAAAPLPVVLYLHGGGFAVGDLDTHEPTCRLLADVARCVVVSVDYRLAPEHPFPAAVDDAVAAYRWLLDHVDHLGARPDQVGVMGDSAGGTLAAVLCLEARRLGLPQPAAQCLVYPLCDLHLRAASYRTFAAGFSLDLRAIEWFRSQYAPDDATWGDERVSPLAATDLSGLAPALVVTAGFDPLRDDGEQYAAALADAGVPVIYRCYDDFIHAFHGMLVHPDTAAASEEIDEMFGLLLRGELP